MFLLCVTQTMLSLVFKCILPPPPPRALQTSINGLPFKPLPAIQFQGPMCVFWASPMSLWLKKKKKKIHLQCRRCRFDPWVRKIPWRRKRQPTPVFLPGKSHGQRSLLDYSSWSCKESDGTVRLNNSMFVFQFLSKQHPHSCISFFFIYLLL